MEQNHFSVYVPLYVGWELKSGADLPLCKEAGQQGLGLKMSQVWKKWYEIILKFLTEFAHGKEDQI